MEVSGYIALSGQLALMRNLDTVATNVANGDTAGYKAGRMLFTDYLADAGRNRDVAYANDVATYEDYAQGPLKVTGRPLDVAIQGDGFFEVLSPNGVRFTRLGSFQVSPDGTLITAEGYTIQGEGTGTGERPITLGEGDTAIIVTKDGTIRARSAAGGLEDRGRLSVVNFDDPQQLEKLGNGFFTAPIAPNQLLPEEVSIAQGMLEKSNVNPTLEMTRMIKISRSVTTLASFQNDMHELQRRSMSTLSRQGGQ